MARIIAVINNKGGVGKTTLCVNLSAFLAGLGKKVLLLDFDNQANATFSVGINPGNLSLSIYNVLMSEINAEAVIKKTSILGFDIFPSCQDLAGANIELVGQNDREFKLAQVLEKIKGFYDFIIIDTPPSLGLLTINGMCAADEVLIPVQTEYLALEGLGQIIKTIDLVEDNLGHQFKFIGAVFSMYGRGNTICREVAKEIRRNFSEYIFEAVIPRSVLLAQAPRSGKSILQYRPHSKVAQAYRYLAQEVIQIGERLEESQLKINPPPAIAPSASWRTDSAGSPASTNLPEGGPDGKLPDGGQENKSI